MGEGKKIRITYDELSDPKVDEALAQQSSVKRREESNAILNIKWRNNFFYKKWLYLMLAGSIGLLLVWGLVTVSKSISAPKDRFLEIGNSKYIFSKEAQKYLKIYDLSDYEKTRSVIIIEEPHYSIDGQFSLYKGLEVFFEDNPSLINKTIFLSEGLPSDQPISVSPLVSVDSNPNEALIKKVLESFLITGYVAYEWNYQKNIPIVGIEDRNLYQLSGKLWVEIQNDKNDQQAVALWNKTVVARNKSIANTLIAKTKVYENPILFVGGLHLRKFYNDDLEKSKSDNYATLISSEESSYLKETENLGVYDYLKREKIGYTFLTPVSSSTESSKDIEKNINRYTKLFQAQQNDDYGEYIRILINEKEGTTKSVTVAPSTQAAAQFVAASASKETSANKKTNDKNDKKKKKKNGKKGNGKKGDEGQRIEEGKKKAEEIKKSKHSIDLGNGKRMDLKGRHPESTGHYNKVTRAQHGYPHVHDPDTPGGVRNPKPEDYLEIPR